jgi:phosphoribosylformylglycinamidine synthase II
MAAQPGLSAHVGIQVTPELATEHGLSPEEYERVLAALGRTPTFEELGIFSVMWSEHCSYKSSRLLLKTLPTSGPHVLQGPGENAGVIDIGDGVAVALKIESHNHPSFIEPYQGAATGVGGILRDIFAMGARPIASLNSLRFGSVDHERTAYLLQGVVAGIGGYGNCIGVPTVGGEVYFDPGYNGNILVNAFTVGLLPRDRIFRASAAGVGNPVMYVGAKTGRDGIHGASLLASAEFDATSESKRPAVQVGDPFTEKLLVEACQELMAGDALAAVQDMGAAGLTSSSVEMAGRGGTGIELNLSAVPMRETGMTPYEVLLSESQERMLFVVKQGREDEVFACCEKWDLDAAIVGRVTDDGLVRALWDGEQVVSIPVAAVADPPAYERPASPPPTAAAETPAVTIPKDEDYGAVLERLLASPNLCSREWIWRQYDHLVGSNTVVGPGGDAAVVRVKGTRRALALTVDCNSRYCALDPYLGTVIAVAEAARNVVAVGARPAAVSDCLNFGNPERPEIMWQFQQAVQGLRDACIALETPVVSGNVSFYNETDGQAIPPTPTVAMVGVLDDVAMALTPWFRAEGDVVVLLGCTREELDGSEYLAVIHDVTSGTPPWIDLDAERRLHRVCLAAARDGLLRSAHDVADGGLAVALAECCMGGPREPHGIRCAVDGGIPVAAFLFGESQSRMVVSLRRRHLGQLRELASEAGLPLTVLGEVRGRRLVVGDVIDVDLHKLHGVWRHGLTRRLAVHGGPE